MPRTRLTNPIRNKIPNSRSLSAIDGVDTVGMTTNGLTLTKKKLISLKKAGLNSVNVSLDTLNHERFVEVSGNSPPFTRSLRLKLTKF